MNNRFAKRFIATLCVLSMMILFTACGKSVDVAGLDRSSVSIDKEGAVVSTMIEDFTESYYDTEELKEMTENEINAFVVSKGEGAAEFVSIDKLDEKVKLVIKFRSASDYAAFNEETFIYETVSDAVLGGQLDKALLVDGDGNVIDSEKASALSGEHVIVASGKKVIASPYKIKYVSRGVKLLDKNIADLSEIEDGSKACIVFNK